jgi:hypothetical protein
VSIFFAESREKEKEKESEEVCFLVRAVFFCRVVVWLVPCCNQKRKMKKSKFKSPQTQTPFKTKV